MEGILAIVMIFGMPVLIVGVSKYFKYKTARLELEKHADPAERKRIEVLETERAQLEERVQNLETIVCSVDLELNARLNRLAAQQTRLALAPPAASGAPDHARALTVAEQATTGEVPVGTLLLGRFQVERTLGQGGMGAVYLATDKQVGEPVALKVIARNLADDPAAVERFRREVSASRKITHPNVIRVYDIAEGDGLLFLSMEYFEGMTLGAVLERRRLLPLAEALPMLAQICQALDAAHAAGVVHRDLKPQNVLVNERKELRVIDFGIAKAMYLEGLTATGLILGTPHYMAPEQIRGLPVDPRADIYSLGAMAYHMLCGKPPFVGDSPITVGFLHCNERPRPPRELKPDLPERVEQAILHCLAKDPASRPQRATDLLTELG